MLFWTESLVEPIIALGSLLSGYHVIDSVDIRELFLVNFVSYYSQTSSFGWSIQNLVSCDDIGDLLQEEGICDQVSTAVYNGIAGVVSVYNAVTATEQSESHVKRGFLKTADLTSTYVATRNKLIGGARPSIPGSVVDLDDLIVVSSGVFRCHTLIIW